MESIISHLGHFLLLPPSPRLTFPPSATRKTPKGFGPSISSPKPKNRNKKPIFNPSNDQVLEDEDSEEDEDAASSTIPEVVTNRMMQRMGLSVGIPLGVGLLFFPLFYYLKVVMKTDVPNWIVVIVSFFFFGASLVGVSYGIVSASWDPLREGSVLGWNEARRNWPVFWQSIRRDGEK